MAARRPKKSMDSELNLIPFINILAMCICFLLMTAVWFQVTAVPVKQSHGTEGAEAAKTYDIELKFAGKNHIQMQILRRGRRWKRRTLKAETMEDLVPQVDGQVAKWLRDITPKKAPPNFKPGTLVATGMVTPKNGVSYGDLVTALDVLRNHDIINLGVVPVGDR